ncbi:YhcN/YlaJ family sporulation lipoprotein [Bacillus chungangensis]
MIMKVRSLLLVGITSSLLFGCTANYDNNRRVNDDNINNPMGVRYNPDGVNRDGVYRDGVRNNRDYTNRTRGDGVNGIYGTNGTMGTRDYTYNGARDITFNGTRGYRDTTRDMQRASNRTGMQSNNIATRDKIDVAENAADLVTKLPEVDTANVLVTDRNAYVAARLNDRSRDDEISPDVESKIAKQVRKADKNIDNVYVSVNPDFYDRVQDYTEDVQRGNPVTGFADEFSELVQRVFPDRR